MTDEVLYIDAGQAAAELGVAVTTLYAYVGRKNIRSQKVPGSRQRRYWKPDIDRVKAGLAIGARGVSVGINQETDITLVTPSGPYFRGRSAIELSDTYTLEQTASLLWQVDETVAFASVRTEAPDELRQLGSVLEHATSTDKAIALLPFLEHASPRAFDLSHLGMCRTGAAVMRWYAAILTGADTPSAQPLHEQIACAVKASPEITELIRRLLVLSADHGFGAGTYAVRAVASTGVSPYRSVLAGLAIVTGRRSKFGRNEGISRLLLEVSEASDPKAIIVRRLREGEDLPGFDSPRPYVNGDPRATLLLSALEKIFGEDRDLKNIAAAIEIVDELQGLKPSFALVNSLLSRKIGLDRRQSLYILGRCADGSRIR